MLGPEEACEAFQSHMQCSNLIRDSAGGFIGYAYIHFLRHLLAGRTNVDKPVTDHLRHAI